MDELRELLVTAIGAAVGSGIVSVSVVRRHMRRTAHQVVTERVKPIALRAPEPEPLEAHG